MNEPMPQWRSFPAASANRPRGAPSGPSSGEPGGSPPAPPGSLPSGPFAAPGAEGGRPWPRWLPPVLAGAGGLIAGVLGVGMAVLVAMGAAAPEHEAAFGEPLDYLPATNEMALAAVPSGLVVDVAGAVLQPGLHRLEAGARVGDAIAAAGGFAPRADLDAASQTLNLAQTLDDGAKVLVPELGTTRLSTVGAAEDERIDLNSADQAELESLPGIGPVTAGKIVDARRTKRFGSVRDLRTRGLVGESVFADIKSLVVAG